MLTRHLRMIAICLPLLAGVTACGESDGSPTTSPSVESVDGPVSSATVGGEGTSSGTSAEVEAFCTQVDEFVEANKKLIDDPQSADIDEITKQGTELATAAGALITSATGEDAARLQECSAKFGTIGN